VFGWRAADVLGRTDLVFTLCHVVIQMRARRVDRNHGEVIKAFRDLGFSVFDTSRVGEGFGDAVIARNNKTAIVEIKDGSKPPSARKLTADEVKFSKAWKGIYLLVENLGQVEAISIEWGKL
jgi:hypothetical protein